MSLVTLDAEFGLGISSKVCFINMLSLFHFHLSFKALFPSVVPKSHQPLMGWTQLTGPGSRTSPCAQGLMPVSPVIQKKMFLTDLPGPLKGTSSRGEMEKKSAPRRDQVSPSRKTDLQGVRCVKHQQHVVSCTIHMPTLQEFSRGISSFQEVLQSLSHIEIDALSPKDLLFSSSGHGLADHGPKILMFHSCLEGL